MSGRGRYETDKKTVRGTVFPSIGVYLAVILDLHSRRVIGWAISNRMKKDLAIRALNMAIALRRPPKGCIHHTDRPFHGSRQTVAGQPAANIVRTTTRRSFASMA